MPPLFNSADPFPVPKHFVASPLDSYVLLIPPWRDLPSTINAKHPFPQVVRHVQWLSRPHALPAILPCVRSIYYQYMRVWCQQYSQEECFLKCSLLCVGTETWNWQKLTTKSFGSGYLGTSLSHISLQGHIIKECERDHLPPSQYIQYLDGKWLYSLLSLERSPPILVFRLLPLRGITLTTGSNNIYICKG